MPDNKLKKLSVMLKEAVKYIKDSEIYKQAQAEAKKILEEAHEKAEELKLHSNEYAKKCSIRARRTIAENFDCGYKWQKFS